ncbi:MAG: DUF2203 family protein [Myxococcota bacterium]
MATFTLEEAEELMPEVQRLTEAAAQKVEALLLEGRDLVRDSSEHKALGEVIQGIINDWATAIVALGAEVKGLWLVDFDSGQGYYCWKHPEETLAYFHTYDAGFSGREPIAAFTLH